MEENHSGGLPVPADQSTREFPAVRSAKKTPKSYIFYCVMTISVMLFTLTFAASELFALFFSEGYPGQMLMTKLFGDGGADKTLAEIMLGQSFLDLSLKKDSTEPAPDTAAPVPDTAVPAPETEPTPFETSTSVPPKPETTPSPAPPPEPVDIYSYDASKIPAGMLGVMPMDLALASYGQDYIYDQSDAYDPDPSSLASVNVSTEGVYPSGAPLVLIVHTHGTEAYTDEGMAWYYPDAEIGRSNDITKNVVSIGARLAEGLNSLGIPTLHCEIMHDETSYTGAYDKSGESIKRYLKEYPSIQYVIDLHRDAIQRSTSEIVRPVAETENGAAAQVMCVVGSGAATVGGEHWKKNLALAQKLRAALNDATPSLCRPTCLRDSTYNQQLAPYSILLELGAAGNTLADAERTADLVADALAKVIGSR